MKYVMIEVAIAKEDELELIAKKLLSEKLVSSLQVILGNSKWNRYVVEFEG